MFTCCRKLRVFTAEIKSRYKFGSEVLLERKLVGKLIEEKRLPRRGDSYQEKVNKKNTTRTKSTRKREKAK
eukprot:snap_masked-scaffold_23-processed-gene-1.35-mRNA-1 protein AED:1.00 eAED:1.00 QI:0/0/0/0/1/1/3/0/70